MYRERSETEPSNLYSATIQASPMDLDLCIR